MKNFSSKIECIKKNHLIVNKEYPEVLDDMHFDSFESVWNCQAGKTIKRIKARSVIRFEIQIVGRKRVFYLKRHNTKFVGIKRILALFSPKLVLSEGKREFENICDFREGGLGTVLPVAAGERFVKFCWVQSFLITEDFSPFISLEYILRDNPEFFRGEGGYEKRPIVLNKISRLARKMHKKGFNHRDFNATHILLHYKDESDLPDIALFDLQRVDRSSVFRFRWIIKSLSELNYTLPEGIFEEEDRISLLLSYKGKKKLNAWDRLQWLWIKRKTARIKRHTDKIIDRKKERKNYQQPVKERHHY
ncbi:MAG: lipopolysaccharide kinase InaA family protein [Acidobacteriota bacterium]|nr:lipopolysaccharide kinase InaA family protein [Acidobacteriota bacterium]